MLGLQIAVYPSNSKLPFEKLCPISPSNYSTHIYIIKSPLQQATGV